ncbi:MAG TPA: hypothetical protein ENI99_05570 [Sedimenticola sp.]|nr:hypothetical protein [Sedimenticola sp.]
MSKRIFNIVRPREYTASDGQVKTAWDRHGVLIVDGKKLSIHLDSIPTGEWNGWFNVFERVDDQPGQANGGQGYQQNRGYQHHAAQNYQQPSQDFDDDIPF